MVTVREIPFFEQETLAAPFEFYARALQESPIIKIPGENIFVVFPKVLIEDALRRPQNFSNKIGHIFVGPRYGDPDIAQIVSQGYPFIDTLLTNDPPGHTRFRSLVNTAFSKPRVDKLSERIRSIVGSLIDGFIDQGRCEFATSFANPLAVGIIADQLGLSDVDGSFIRLWSEAIADRMGGMVDKEREMQAAREIVQLQKKFKSIIESRRKQNKDDLLGSLIDARVDGERPLDDVELISLLQHLMAAGNGTTTAMMMTGLMLLLRYPAELERTRQDPVHIPRVVEEMLRFDPPVHGLWRVAMRDAELGGVRFPDGALVQLRVGAANHDPSAFKNPEQFDPSRKERHVSFGSGPHVCIGNMLARKELTIAFEELLRRLDHIRLEDGEKIEYRQSRHTHVPAHLNIRFEKRAS